MGLIWSAGLMVSKAMKQSTGTLVPHKLRDSSFLHLLTRTRRPLSVTWRQHHILIVCIKHKRTSLWLQTKPKRLDYGLPWGDGSVLQWRKGTRRWWMFLQCSDVARKKFLIPIKPRNKRFFFFKMIKKWIFKIPIWRHY